MDLDRNLLGARTAASSLGLERNQPRGKKASTEGTMADNPADNATVALDPADRADQRRANRHWIVVELFEIAKEEGLASPGWEPFSSKIEESTGTKIAAGTLKYWYHGWSTPKVDEVEAMAETLGYELDILKEKS